jgi:hypothetical protein
MAMIGPGGSTTVRQGVANLRVEDVARFFRTRVALSGNERLRLGKVFERDRYTIAAEIVTDRGAPVAVYHVDRQTGIVRLAR